jgi:aldehyde:ferredoxin oxidoreductase
MAGGYVGKIGYVNLSNGEIREEKLDEKMARDYIGGHGLGARVLFENQRGGVDPLGPENILGFVTGPLTGAPVPTGGRYMVVCKSPLTGGWGDANSGGVFGPELKFAGFDAIFISGIAPKPTYLSVTNAGIEIKDASHLWGKDTIETEEALVDEIGDPKVRVACIGPAAEKLSLISGICNDKGRYAGRSGVGAVMGSKRLKAVAVRGKGKVPVADREGIKKLNQEFVRAANDSGFVQTLSKYGTCGSTKVLVDSGASPIKNWQQHGPEAFPTIDNIGGDSIIAHETKKYGCYSCSIRCGGIVSVPSGKYPITESHKPEYETIAAFGNLCLNDDVASIFKVNDICNRSGLDTISAGTAIAFAMECYEHGVITKEDTDGIEMTWGNADAIVAMTDKMARRDGFGAVLADGVKVAAGKIGKGAEKFAMHIGGQEPGMHSSLLLPGRATGYAADPTPGRHTAAGAYTRVDVNAAIGPYKELEVSGFQRYQYSGKGSEVGVAVNYWQVGSCAGLCLMAVVFAGNLPLLDLLNGVTGWDMTLDEIQQAGARIQTLRQSFNVREGIVPAAARLPDRMLGKPPRTQNPFKGVTIDIDTLTREYREAMDWDPETGKPTETCLSSLGLGDLVKE